MKISYLIALLFLVSTAYAVGAQHSVLSLILSVSFSVSSFISLLTYFSLKYED